MDASGRDLGAEISSTDPAGNKVLTGASEALRQLLIERIGDEYFTSYRRGNSATEAIFTRKVGHTQRGGRPLLFDRFYGAQLGAKALEVLVEGRTNVVATLQWNSRQGFWVDSHDANGFRDRWAISMPEKCTHPFTIPPK